MVLVTQVQLWPHGAPRRKVEATMDDARSIVLQAAGHPQVGQRAQGWRRLRITHKHPPNTIGLAFGSRNGNAGLAVCWRIQL